jgi:hypothetical protein
MPTWAAATVAVKGIYAALIALVFAVLFFGFCTQTVRLEGFKLWPFHMEGWKPMAIRQQDEIARIKAAQKSAAEAAKRARLAQEALYNKLAEEADAKLEAMRRDAQNAAERYIAAHRLPRPAHRPSSGPGTAGKGDSAQGSDGPGEAPELDADIVSVSADDIRICTANTSRLIAVRQWALALPKATP